MSRSWSWASSYSSTAGSSRRRFSIAQHHAEVRRPGRVVRSFPDEPWLMRPLGALAIGREDQWRESRYMVFTVKTRRRSSSRTRREQVSGRSM